MCEVTIERVCHFDEIQDALSRQTGIETTKIIDIDDYWNSNDFSGYLGLDIVHKEGDHETLLTIYEISDSLIDSNKLAEYLAKKLKCQVAVPFEGIIDQSMHGMLNIFDKDGKKYRGYGEDLDEGFIVTITE